jgi:hypothetical protein
MENTKICKYCGIEYPISMYEKTRNRCKPCRKIQRREEYLLNIDKNREYRRNWAFIHYDERKAKLRVWQLLNPDKMKKYSQKWKTINRDIIKDRRIKTHYGLTPDEHDRLFVKQDGRCAICDKDACELKKLFHVDHDHKTGKVRGLLCESCNHLIGNALDNVNILLSAIDYLEAT